MKRLSTLKKIAIIGTTALMATIIAVILTATAGAASGNVNVSGTNNAKISVSISDLTADFGTFDPTGSISSGDEVDDSLTSSSGNQGVCLLWSALGATGVEVRVHSNKPWTGTLAATENGGTSTSLTLANGDFRYHTSAPVNYSACNTGGTAFSTGGATFEADGARGVSTYNHYYSLTVDWDDVPGTFSSTVTYTATQS
jgi:hypothetical protein